MPRVSKYLLYQTQSPEIPPMKTNFFVLQLYMLIPPGKKKNEGRRESVFAACLLWARYSVRPFRNAPYLTLTPQERRKMILQGVNELCKVAL